MIRYHKTEKGQLRVSARRKPCGFISQSTEIVESTISTRDFAQTKFSKMLVWNMYDLDGKPIRYWQHILSKRRATELVINFHSNKNRNSDIQITSP